MLSASPSSSSSSIPRGSFLSRHPVSAYLCAAFGISWAGAFAVASPHLLRHEPVPQLSGLIMFPVMLLGPAVAGMILTAATMGGGGMRLLARRMTKLRIPLRWYGVLLIPSLLVLSVLWLLSHLVSASFSPNHFVAGIGFGIVAGFLEEIGWTGFAYPAMARLRSPFIAAVQLGILWGLWHLPVVDYLGAASPHGHYWLPFFGAFLVAMTAIRVLICWAYVHLESVPFAQLLHAASTAALVVFSPRVTPAQEAAWYAVYGGLLWCLVVVIVAVYGRTLKRI